MKDYCTLHIRSDTNSALPENLLQRDLDVLFTDNESPERVASFARLAAKGINKRKNLPRYHWILSSEGYVDGSDVHEHIFCILNRLGPDLNLSRLQLMGFDCLLQFYWESNGTGAGPLITPEVAELLVKNKVSLQFGFYCI